ncbi:putative membrane protein YesL [Virgibacillus natechei]|uniref:Membrane protein YesL n=1 Tax=Virgibacillus natechei TaxID=1216297 RepID=A0ABS4IEF6_9BACI|nr:YesL family protein [Virgibacillus natechei]MBP1969334.1 putative membrane protein YesL [Virgibacillus natechei]UZD12485.1 YesL family protein [Virgibacillus natechei]
MIEREGFLGGLYTIMEWITRIAYVNILWIVFTFLGLFILGVAPATVSMFTITRKWVKGNTDSKIFVTFWDTYKTEFVRSNVLLWPLIIIGYILYIDFQYLTYVEGYLFLVMLFIFINVTIIYLITLLYIFPVYVNFQYSLVQNYKYAFMIGISKPLITISMVVSLTLIGLLMEQFLGLIPFFLASSVSLILMWFANRAFVRMKQ